jgi:hypothetical protein
MRAISLPDEQTDRPYDGAAAAVDYSRLGLARLFPWHDDLSSPAIALNAWGFFLAARPYPQSLRSR